MTSPTTSPVEGPKRDDPAGAEAALLRVAGVSSGYGDMTVLRNVNLAARAGTVTAVAGANGAGKTTLLRTILGMLPATQGTITLNGRDITTTKVARRIGLGMGIVPEGRGLFATMTVSDNLRLGGRAGGLRGPALAEGIGRIYDLFPVLSERSAAPAGSLSGGQQQMLALARTLVAGPQVILLDEPSMGLAPKVWVDFLTLARTLADEGRVIVLAEQKIRPVLDISDECVVLRRGEVVFDGPADSEHAETSIHNAYLEMAPTTGAQNG